MANNSVMDIVGFHLVTDPHGCFSNWAPSGFTYAGRWYSCAEQYMMAQKVAMGRRYDLLFDIMDARDPARMKELADKDHYPEFMSIKPIWDKNCRHIVKRGVKAKFQQNPKMLQELLNTGDALLCECAGQDTIWGIGINLHNPAWNDVKNWKGNNYLGIILMEVREELRKELSEKGPVQYIDFRDAVVIPEWTMLPNQLKCIPQYYSAIHAYGDTLRSSQEHKAFYNDYSFEDWDIAMCTNMGGGLPISGFYEMKQEIYEIARRLKNQSFVSDIFRSKPNAWGSRGHPFFWQTLESAFAFDDLSMTEEELKDKIFRIFEKKTSQNLTEEVTCYVEEYAHGGMSSGILSGDWIVNICIPMLQDRLREMKWKANRTF